MSIDSRRPNKKAGVRVGAETYVRQSLAILARDDLRPILPTISAPTQVIVGEADRMTPPAMSREIHGTIRRSELHLIPLCGHLPPIEKPAEMAKPLASLLENIA